jgi:hypothetical protein
MSRQAHGELKFAAGRASLALAGETACPTTLQNTKSAVLGSRIESQDGELKFAAAR